MILIGNCKEKLKEIQDNSIQTCITSPPYWGLRDYGVSEQIGLEQSPQDYVQELVKVFREVWRCLKDDGTLWLNLGDSYASTKEGNTNGTSGKVKQKATINDNAQKRTIPDGLKPKDLVGIPWLVAFALQADGWYLRQDIIWAKPNPMPESVTDRCTKSHEYVFLLSKSRQYYFDNEAIKEPSVSYATDKRADEGRFVYDSKFDGTLGTGNQAFVTINETRNKRDVWNISTKPFKGAHFAVMPEALVEPCVLAGSKVGDIVLDPFMGAGTVGLVSQRYQREFIGIELNAEYAALAKRRMVDCGDVVLL